MCFTWFFARASKKIPKIINFPAKIPFGSGDKVPLYIHGKTKQQRFRLLQKYLAIQSLFSWVVWKWLTVTGRTSSFAVSLHLKRQKVKNVSWGTEDKTTLINLRILEQRYLRYQNNSFLYSWTVTAWTEMCN